MPRVEKLSVHSHDFSQILVYLGGSGFQELGGEKLPVARGSILVIPPCQSHRFIKTDQRPPVCLVIDCDQETWVLEPQTARASLHELARIEARLLDVSRAQAANRSTFQQIVPLVELIGIIDARLAARPLDQKSGPIVDELNRLIQQLPWSEVSPATLARRADRTVAHLTRLLQAEVGLSLSQLIDQSRLEAAETALGDRNLTIAAAARQVGILDPNYFSRWFRRKSGRSPREFRQSDRAGRE
ncbi:MAG: AraC family transcriptional regulator [Verrucomicrobiota bacterium]